MTCLLYQQIKMLNLKTPNPLKNVNVYFSQHTSKKNIIIFYMFARLFYFILYFVYIIVKINKLLTDVLKVF